MINLADPTKKLSPMNKATLVSFILGKAYMKNLDILLHELKVSGDKELIALAKAKQKTRLRMHADYREMFKSADNYLNKQEIAALEESIDAMISALW